MNNQDLSSKDIDVSLKSIDVKMAGWLRFYKIMNIISLCLSGLVIGFLVISPMLEIKIYEGDYDLAATILEILPAFAFSWVILKIINISEAPSSYGGSIFYSFIWMSYFKGAKRVREFYGKNATKIYDPTI